jgi:predicted O-methyltransferase YrrM
MNHTPKTRAALALFVPDGGIMIELGVAAGLFADQLIKANPKAEYIGIDRWSDHHDGKEMRAAQILLGTDEPSQCTLIRATFAESLSRFDDASADLIYIDGYAHTGQDNGQTLDDWWPKLKHGGIFAGHDYCKEYHQTVRVVDAFVAKHGATLNIINDSDCPSWWIIKD